MARTRSPEVQKRNDAIYARWLRGASLTSLADTYSLSRQVVGRIVAAQHPEEAEDDDRALYRGYMWRLYDEVQEIGENPGFKMQPNGRPAEDLDGNPALDTNIQIQAKDLQLKIIRELRLLDARDRPAKKPQLDETEAWRQMRASILAEEERIEARRRAMEAQERRIVQGEVLGELPPSPPPGQNGSEEEGR